MVRKPLCRKQHGQDSGVGMADGIDTDAAHHRRHRAVRFRLDPGGPMLQTQMRKPGQQHATRRGARALRQRGMVSEGRMQHQQRGWLVFGEMAWRHC